MYRILYNKSRQISTRFFSTHYLSDLLETIRNRGHVVAHLDPLGLSNKAHFDLLNIENQIINKLVEEARHDEFTDDTLHFWNISIEDLDKPYIPGSNVNVKTVIVDMISKYCGTSSLEASHIRSMGRRLFLRNHWEADPEPLDVELQKKIASWLIEAESFEQFLAKKFPNTKRFGIEGAECLIVAIQSILYQAKLDNIERVEFGMAHRGRLNVLANILNKPLGAIFSEFKDRSKFIDSGDVKYHLGTNATLDKLKVSLAPNPSHLELVDPVVIGRAKAVSTYNHNNNVLGLLIHGDGSFSGQGIVGETFQLCRAPAYDIPFISIVLNNQIAFTTTTWKMLKTKHPTDMARGSGVPIFHVNGNDINEVFRVCKLATLYRDQFNQSVVINLVTYRKFGHNETDDPTITHPILYQKIKSHASTVTQYCNYLINSNIMNELEIKTLKDLYQIRMLKEYEMIDKYKANYTDWLSSNFDVVIHNTEKINISTVTSGVEQNMLEEITKKITNVPKEFKLHKTVKTMLKQRYDMVFKNHLIDWSMSEMLAIGILLMDGSFVRLTGQDSERGTFNQRHAVWFDQLTGEPYSPLHSLIEDSLPSRLMISNSPLIELAATGFEFGFSTIDPPEDRDSLVLFEFQFGDFANMSQPIIDTFIASSSTRWSLDSNLVLMLPHGLEGQGPEHSSCRIERFLNLLNDDETCVFGLSPERKDEFTRVFEEIANGRNELNSEEIQVALKLTYPEVKHFLKLADVDNNGFLNRDEFVNFMCRHYKVNSSICTNFSVVQPSTPANYFHVLIRQAKRNYKRPLILVTPKFLLHHSKCRSHISKFLTGTQFEPIIIDGEITSSIQRIIFCSGKISYTLKKYLQNRNELAKKVLILRVEQIAPFPYDEIAQVLKYVSQKTDNCSLMWVQEEARNQGARHYFCPRLDTLRKEMLPNDSTFKGDIMCVTRPPNNCTSVASFHVHLAQEQKILQEAFADL